MQTATQRVREAINNLKTIAPSYWVATLQQRAGVSDKAAGSIYPDLTETQLEKLILTAEWKPYDHPAVANNCTAFKSPIPGSLGILDLTTVNPNTLVTLQDTKNTGELYPTVTGVRGKTVDFTVIILGQHEGKEIVFTFHPGEPIAPSHVINNELTNRQIPVSQAISMGFRYAKIT